MPAGRNLRFLDNPDHAESLGLLYVAAYESFHWCSSRQTIEKLEGGRFPVAQEGPRTLPPRFLLTRARKNDERSYPDGTMGKQGEPREMVGSPASTTNSLTSQAHRCTLGGVPKV